MSLAKVDVERSVPADIAAEAESACPEPDLGRLPHNHRLAVWIAAVVLPWAAIALAVAGLLSLR